MRPFDELTPRGRARRLRQLALHALRTHYGVSPRTVRLVSMHSFNTTFRVDTEDDRFAMRIGDACRIHPVGVETIEATWLDRLHEEGFRVARNIATIDGARFATVDYEGVPSARVCTLFTWVSGREVRAKPTTEAFHAAGMLLGRLHDQAASMHLDLPDELDARHAIYFGDHNLVAEHASEHGELFRDATDRVQDFVDALWREALAPPHLLHGDFGPHNLLRFRGSLTPIDFQDMRVGFALQDLGITLTDLARSRPEFIEPLMAGYEHIRTAPDLSPEQLGLLAAGRSLNIMNLALLSPDSGIGAAFEVHAQRVIDWMMSTH